MIAEAGIKPRLRCLRRRAAGVRHRDVVLPDAFRPLAAGGPLPGGEVGRAADRPQFHTGPRLRVRDRKYLGEATSIQDTLPEGRMKLYALLDYRVTGVTVKVIPGPHSPAER